MKRLLAIAAAISFIATPSFARSCPEPDGGPGQLVQTAASGGERKSGTFSTIKCTYEIDGRTLVLIGDLGVFRLAGRGWEYRPAAGSALCASELSCFWFDAIDADR